MSRKTYELTIPISDGRYITLHADRIAMLRQLLNKGWCVSIDDGQGYFLDAGSTIRTPGGKLYNIDRFPMLAELLNLEKSLEEL